MVRESTTIGERFVLPRQVGWRAFPGVRQYGVDGGEVPSVLEALREQHLDFTVLTVPSVGKMPDGSEIELTDRIIVREARNGFERRTFGTCGAKWNPIQNEELATILQPFADQFRLDALGHRDDGTELLVVFYVERVEIAGDRIDVYLLVRDSKKFGHALTFEVLPVRFQCTNQLRTAPFSVPVIHVGDVGDGVQLNIDVFRTLEITRQRTYRAFEAMTQRVLTQEEIDRVLQLTYPDPSVPKKVRTLLAIKDAEETAAAAGIEVEKLSEGSQEKLDTAWKYYQYYLGRARGLRTDAQEVIVRYNEARPDLKDTAWHVYNAIVELADYRNAIKDESLAEATLFGYRAAEKTVAFDAVLELSAPEFNTIPEYVPEPSGRVPRTAAEKAVKKVSESRARLEARLAEMSPEERAAYEERAAAHAERAAARAKTAQDPETIMAEARMKAERAQTLATRAMERAKLIEERMLTARAKLDAKRAEDEARAVVTGSADPAGQGQGEDADLAGALAAQQEPIHHGKKHK